VVRIVSDPPLILVICKWWVVLNAQHIVGQHTAKYGLGQYEGPKHSKWCLARESPTEANANDIASTGYAQGILGKKYRACRLGRHRLKPIAAHLSILKIDGQRTATKHSLPARPRPCCLIAMPSWYP
jgi:hypothetical protein